MDRDAVEGYLRHRLQAAGGDQDRVLFPPEITGELHRRTGGVPRLVNRVCDRALQLAYERRVEYVDQEILDTALSEIGSTTLSPTWDSIIFAAPTTAPPATRPASIAAPATVVAADTDETALLNDDHLFKSEIEQWVAQDLAPTPRRLAPRTPRTPAFVDEAPVAPAPEPRRSPRTGPTPEAPVRPVATDWPRNLRSETYLQKLLRTWAKIVAIGLALFLAVSTVIAGASTLPGMLARPGLPALPAVAPVAAPAAPGNALLEAPPAETPPAESPAAAPVAAGSSEEYFVAVGLFADPGRADQIVDALTEVNLPAMQRPFQLGRRQVQQIVLGPFFSRADAVTDLRRLKGFGGDDDANVVDNARVEP